MPPLTSKADDPVDLQTVILFTVRQLRAVGLREIIAGIQHADSRIAPGTIHDHLNNLIAEGLIELSAAGVYLPVHGKPFSAAPSSLPVC